MLPPLKLPGGPAHCRPVPVPVCCLSGSAIALVAACLAVPALAGAAEPAARPGAVVVEQQQSCASVVIRHCRLKFVPGQHLDGDDSHPAVDLPAHWEAVRNATYDTEEIVVEGAAMRDPGVRDIFQRYFGTPVVPHNYVTKAVRGGARCTTDTSTGVRVCSRPGSEGYAPIFGADFSDTVF